MRYRNQDDLFMAQALRLARRGLGKTSPNPAVGCVIVKDGVLVGGGFHHKADSAHAEIIALAQAKDKAAGAIAYVTLEPCNIYGRTPPCTESLIASGIKRVVVGAIDPNPKVNGKGIKRLRQANIEVISGVLKDDCEELIKPYAKFITTGLPFVTVKYAQSLDGRIATKSGSSRWISSPESLKFAHRLRVLNDAILVGARTANTDNPQLTTRLVKGKNPIRVILTQTGKLKKNLNLLVDGQAQTIVASNNNIKLPVGIEFIKIPAKGKSLDLKKLLKKLGEIEITSLLIEGGSQTITSFLKQGLVDRIILVTAPIIIGEGISAVGDLGTKTIAGALKFKTAEIAKIGPDCIVTGDI